MSRKTSWASPLLYSVVFFACVLPVYDMVSSPLMFLMIALALIWRYEMKHPPDGARKNVLRGRTRSLP